MRFVTARCETTALLSGMVASTPLNHVGYCPRLRYPVGTFVRACIKRDHTIRKFSPDSDRRAWNLDRKCFIVKRGEIER